MTVTDRATATRTRILDACTRLFVERGGSNVSVEDVAEEAGVGRATIYRHFEDRDAMVQAAVRHHGRGTVAAMNAAVAAHEGFVDRIAALAAVMARIAVDTRLDTRRRDLHDHHLAEVFVAGIDRIVTDTSDFVEPLVVEAVERGELDGHGLDVRGYADWVTRILVSVLLVPGSATADMRDPDQVEAYVRRHLLAGRPPSEEGVR